MGADVDRAKAYDGAADKQEDKNDENGEEDSEEFAASADFKVFPFNIFRGWNFLILDDQFLSMEQVFFFRVVDATATAASHAIMAAAIKEIVIVEIGEAVHFWFLVLKVDESWDCFWEYLQFMDVFIQFLSLLFKVV